MFKFSFAAAALAMCASIAAAPSHAAILDFAGLNNAAIVTDFDFGGGLTGTASAKNKNDRNREVVVFDTTAGGPDVVQNTINDPDLISTFQNVDDLTEFRDFGKALIIQSKNEDRPDDQAGGGMLELAFDVMVEFRYIDLLDIEELTRIFVDGGEVASGKVTNRGQPHSQNQYKRFDLTGIKGETLTIHFGGSGAIGEIATIPLPPALLALGFGLGGLGLVARRQRKARAV